MAGIVPVHLYGQMADMDPILELAAKYNLIVIEDACQAHGAEYFSKKENRWRRPVRWARPRRSASIPARIWALAAKAARSRRTTKPWRKRMRMIRDHGQAKKYYHDIEGYNGRLDSIQAGWLSVKLRHLAKWNESRRNLAHRYHELSGRSEGWPGSAQSKQPGQRVFTTSTLYACRIAKRSRHFWESGNRDRHSLSDSTALQKAYQHLGYKKGDFPVTERVAREIVSLPMFPQLTHDQQNEVVAKVKEFAGARVAATT